MNFLMSIDIDRIAVLIGKNGSTKKMIEDRTGTIIHLDSKTGDYSITAKPLNELKKEEEPFPDDLIEPSVRKYVTENIIKAINYGFNPIVALKLIDADYLLEISNLEQILGHSEKKIKRVKGRIIGDKGKIRTSIEQFSGAHLSIWKKYISIIGDYEALRIAKKAIDMIIQGDPHMTVLNYLQHEYQKKKQEEFTKMWKPTI